MLEKMFLRSSCIGKIERKFRDDGEHTPVTRVITLSAIRRISSKPRGFWYRVTTIKITNCSKMIRQNHICKTSHQDRSTTSKDRNGTFSHFLFTNGFSTYGLIMNNVVKIDSIRRFTCVLPVIHMWKWNARKFSTMAQHDRTRNRDTQPEK